MTHSQPPLTPSPRTLLVLEHLLRFRLTTQRVLRQAILVQDTPAAIGKLLSRLCQSGWLRRFPLAYPSHYYLLAPRGTKYLGCGLHRADPLGPQALPREYAVLAYCLLGQQRRFRLTSQEIVRHFPWLPVQLTRQPHAVRGGLAELIHGAPLELLRVDWEGTPDHVARKCFAEIAARCRLAPFTPLVARGGFRLVLITATAEKARAVQAALDARSWPTGLQIHFSIVSELQTLLLRRRHA